MESKSETRSFTLSLLLTARPSPFFLYWTGHLSELLVDSGSLKNCQKKSLQRNQSKKGVAIVFLSLMVTNNAVGWAVIIHKILMLY